MDEIVSLMREMDGTAIIAKTRCEICKRWFVWTATMAVTVFPIENAMQTISVPSGMRIIPEEK